MPSSTSSSLRWLSLVGTIWLQSITGTNFNFPAYSSQLKTLLSMNQLQLNNLAFASDAGKVFGWFSGITAAHLPLWLLLLIGSFLSLIGYGVQYLFLTNQIASLSYWQVFLLSTLAGNSICWINTVCYVVAIKNFPSNRLVAVGLSTSYQGLSAKIYTAIVDAVLLLVKPSIVDEAAAANIRAKVYLFLSALLPLLVCTVTAPFARDIVNKNTSIISEVEGTSGRKKRGGGLVLLFVISIGTGIFAVFGSLGTNHNSQSLSPLGSTIGLGVFLLAPLLVPLAAKIRQTLRQKKWTKCEKRVHVIVEHCDDDDDDDGIMENIGEVKEGDESVVTIRDGGGGGVEEEMEIGVKGMLRRVEFWLYFFVYMLGATIGLVFLNNLGQIAESRGSRSGNASLVSLSSSFGFFGRLMPSLLDYFFSGNVHMISKPASMAGLMGPMCGAFFLLLHKSEVALYISTAIIGVCTGAITSIAVSVTTELFGTKNFSMNHNVLVANIPMGSFVFGTLAALSYRQEGVVSMGADGGCIGRECYRVTFIIWGSLCSFGTILAWILYARTRKFYSSHKF